MFVDTNKYEFVESIQRIMNEINNLVPETDPLSLALSGKHMKIKRNNTITELKNSKNIEKIFRKSEYNRENIPLSSILQNKNDYENIGKKSSKNM